MADNDKKETEDQAIERRLRELGQSDTTTYPKPLFTGTKAEFTTRLKQINKDAEEDQKKED